MMNARTTIDTIAKNLVAGMSFNDTVAIVNRLAGDVPVDISPATDYMYATITVGDDRDYTLDIDFDNDDNIDDFYVTDADDLDW